PASLRILRAPSLLPRVPALPSSLAPLRVRLRGTSLSPCRVQAALYLIRPTWLSRYKAPSIPRFRAQLLKELIQIQLPTILLANRTIATSRTIPPTSTFSSPTAP